MITDAIMELLYRMIDLTTGTAYAEGINMVIEALGDYDEDDWLYMSQKEKDDYLINAIRRISI